jgi:choline-sulfatase
MDPPHVVLLTVDCLRADRVGCYGYDSATTPVIDSLAADGYRWERCYSTGPRTNESFPGIVASALSTDCGYISQPWHRSPPTPTIASWLSENGYHTAARLANPQLAELKGYNYGFDSFHNLAVGNVGWGVAEEDSGTDAGESESTSLVSAVGEHIHDVRSRIRSANSLTRWTVYAPLFYAYREYQRRRGWPTVDGRDVARALSDTLSAHGDTPDEPVFRWAHFNDIHAPIHPERVHRSELESISTVTQYNADIRRISQHRTSTYDRMYDSMVRYVDTQVGTVVRRLKESGRWDDAVVVVTADHGEALYDRGVHGHASGKDRYLYDDSRDYMYDELLHVPLVVGGGAVDGSGTVTEPISTAWVSELIAEVAGVTPGEFVRHSDCDSHLDPSTGAVLLADALTDRGHTFAAVSGRHKLVTKSLRPDDPVLDDAQYFDLASDPEEREPRAGRDAPDELADAIRGNVITLDDLENTAPSMQLSSETEELLSQLGYAE